MTQVGDRIWLISFMQYDLGYFDDKALDPIENPFGPKVLPMCPERVEPYFTLVISAAGATMDAPTPLVLLRE